MRATDTVPWPKVRHVLYVEIRRALLDELGGDVMRAGRATTRALDEFERSQWPEAFR